MYGRIHCIKNVQVDVGIRASIKIYPAIYFLQELKSMIINLEIQDIVGEIEKCGLNKRKRNYDINNSKKKKQPKIGM